jgi:hypothetical protein
MLVISSILRSRSSRLSWLNGQIGRLDDHIAMVRSLSLSKDVNEMLARHQHDVRAIKSVLHDEVNPVRTCTDHDLLSSSR